MAHDTLVKKKFKNEISKVRQQGDAQRIKQLVEGREDKKKKKKRSFLKGLFGDFKKKSSPQGSTAGMGSPSMGPPGGRRRMPQGSQGRQMPRR